MAGSRVVISGRRMSTERIKQLHEQASERYLNGDYQGALAAWRDVLGLDPENEQALDGSNLASQFVEQGAPATATAKGDVEQELDQGLKVLDGIGTTTLLQSDASDGTVDRKPGPVGVVTPESEELLEGWETPPASADDGSFGLAPMGEASPDPSTPMSAAAAELSRRVHDLLAEAKAKADAGERDEALAILFRLAILDEDNAEAAQLRAKIEASGASDLEKVERAIIEGVAALEAAQLDDAERYFKEVLDIVPGHREAQHYLEKVAQRRSHADEELLGSGVGEAAPAENAVAHATVAEPAPPKKETSPRAPRPAPASENETPELALATSGPGFSLGPSKLILWGGGAVLVFAVAAAALPRLIGAGSPASGVRATSTPPPRTTPAPRPAPRPKPGAASTRVASGEPQDTARAVASSLARGRSLIASEDFGGAVIAFNEALSLDPKNAEARAGFEEAGERYKASKAEREAINSIRSAFRDGEFSSGLRVAYRLPPTVSPSFTSTVKCAGWYNLAIVALRAGDCREAMSHLDETLEIAPADADAKQLREFAARYVDAVKDRAFLDRVEALAFRTLPPS
jgi:tetratricopeptide (TPR) repeat protein